MKHTINQVLLPRWLAFLRSAGVRLDEVRELTWRQVGQDPARMRLPASKRRQGGTRS
jgi:hypothetical protein